MIGNSEEITEQNSETLAKLSIDSIKENDLKFMFEVLASPYQNRTIADLDSLIQPIKKLQNISAVYFLCRRMILSKYKSKDIVYDNSQSADALYVILNGKVALYKKSSEYFQSDEVIFLNSGSCFGKLYEWKVKFLPISVEQTLLAIAPKNEVNKIPMHLSYQRQIMIQQLKSSDIFMNIQGTPYQIQQASKLLTLIKVPCGNFLIRQGETPKALFYVLKGIIKKIINQNDKMTQVKRYFQGQYFPKKLKQQTSHDLIAQTACQIIVIPKKCLKIVNSHLLNQTTQIHSKLNIQGQLNKKKQWEEYKQSYLKSIMNVKKSSQQGQIKQAKWNI